jgi:hypothetical protein
MIQLGSGIFECNIDNEIVLSGEIKFLNDTAFGSTKEKLIHLDKTSNDFQGYVSENEIYSILKNNGLNLEGDFKNITNFEIYKNNIQCSVKWRNDWIYFLEGLFQFPFLEHLGTGPVKIPVYIRELCISPALFENHLEKGILKILIVFILRFKIWLMY